MRDDDHTPFEYLAVGEKFLATDGRTVWEKTPRNGVRRPGEVDTGLKFSYGASPLSTPVVVAGGRAIIRYHLRRVWLWITGNVVCFAGHSSGEAFCKRRPGHWGKHRTASGFEWESSE